MNEQADEIARRLAAARKAKGWTQKQLGTAMGFTPEDGQVRVSRWEKGQVRLRREDIELAARAMGMAVFSLTPESEVENVLEGLEAIVRHQAGLSERDAARLTEAIAVLSQRVGPPPAEDDDAGWEAYLARLRECLVQAHRAELRDIDSRGSPGS